jgi:hypothetical protein
MKFITKRARICGYCKQKLQRRGRGRPPRYCSAACRQRAYRKRCVNKIDPVTLVVRDMRQLMETERIKSAVKQVMQDIGLLDFFKKLGFEPPEPAKRPNLRLVERPTPPIGK